MFGVLYSKTLKIESVTDPGGEPIQPWIYVDYENEQKEFSMEFGEEFEEIKVEVIKSFLDTENRGIDLHITLIGCGKKFDILFYHEIGTKLVKALKEVDTW